MFYLFERVLSSFKFKKQPKTNIQRLAIKRENTIALSQLIPIFIYSLYRKQKKKKGQKYKAVKAVEIPNKRNLIKKAKKGK